MSRSVRATIGGLLLLLVTTACSKPGQDPADKSTAASIPSSAAQQITSESVVKVEAQPVTIPPGESAEAVVRIKVQSGYHINANPPTFPYLKATALEIPSADGVSVAFITYPKALERQFAFADQPLAVYEGETALKATLKADKEAKIGERSIPARLRIQACDEQVCYPPGELELTIPVNVK